MHASNTTGKDTTPFALLLIGISVTSLSLAHSLAWLTLIVIASHSNRSGPATNHKYSNLTHLTLLDNKSIRWFWCIFNFSFLPIVGLGDRAVAIYLERICLVQGLGFYYSMGYSRKQL